MTPARAEQKLAEPVRMSNFQRSNEFATTAKLPTKGENNPCICKEEINSFKFTNESAANVKILANLSIIL